MIRFHMLLVFEFDEVMNDRLILIILHGWGYGILMI